MKVHKIDKYFDKKIAEKAAESEVKYAPFHPLSIFFLEGRVFSNFRHFW